MQGTEAELQVHRDESMTHHLEMGVEHTAQVGLDVATITRQTQVIYHLYLYITFIVPRVLFSARQHIMQSAL